MTATEALAERSARVWYIEIDSPIGQLVVVSSGGAITGLYMQSHRHGPVDRGRWVLDSEHEQPALVMARQQLTEYFAGERATFELRLGAVGTDTQKSVWRALSDIPFGETRTYGA
ncbi:MAG: cysteine methyltransferase, partial [Gemmatimonadaceae bacterium]